MSPALPEHRFRNYHFVHGFFTDFRGVTPVGFAIVNAATVLIKKLSSMKVSVIVPVYDVERYLRQCLDSLVNQTLDDIEIIAVDDGSTDGSLAILQEYERRYPAVLVLRQNNSGPAAARNLGLKHATGEFVSFVDGDDWVDVAMLKTLYERGTKDGSDVVLADALVFSETDQRLSKYIDRPVIDAITSRFKTGSFRAREEPHVLLMQATVWRRLFRRSFLDRIGFAFPEDLIVVEDMPVHFTLLLRANLISLVGEPLYIYRIDRPGRLTDRTDRRSLQLLDAFDRIQVTMREEKADAQMWAMYLKVQLGCCLWMFQKLPESLQAEFFPRWCAQFGQVPAPAFECLDRETADFFSRLALKFVRTGQYERMRLLCSAWATTGGKARLIFRFVTWRDIPPLLRGRIAGLWRCIDRFFGGAAREGIARI